MLSITVMTILPSDRIGTLVLGESEQNRILLPRKLFQCILVASNSAEGSHDRDTAFDVDDQPGTVA